MILVIIYDDTRATSASIVYVFGIGDLLGRKVGQVTTHAQWKWRTVLLFTITALSVQLRSVTGPVPM